jgi:DNA-directed RNA polymerase specialized sigma24 family protein
MSYRVISNRCQISIEAAKSRVRRAQQRVRRLFGLDDAPKKERIIGLATDPFN